MSVAEANTEALLCANRPGFSRATSTSPRKCTLTFWSCLQCLEVAGLCYLTLGVVLQVTGVGYNGQGEVLLNGEVIHGFSCQSISKIVEVRSFVSQLRSSH